MSLDGCAVEFIGVSGATARDLEIYARERLNVSGIRVIHIEVGSNDLSKGWGSRLVFSDIKNLNTVLRTKGINGISVGEVFYRRQGCRQMAVALEDYNNEVDLLNALLEDYCEDNVKFCRHARVHGDKLCDGIHLKYAYQKYLWRTV